MMRPILTAALLALSAPAIAQTTAAASAPAPAAATDPARLAAATRVVAQVWPLGTYRRMMDGMLDKVMASVIGSIDALPAGKMADANGKNSSNETFGQAMVRIDPAYEERRRISTKIMTDELTELMTGLEPQVQTALTRAYARRFTESQLHDLNQFFATPTGTVYAREMMTLNSDPEMMAAMQSALPLFLQHMPAIMEKAKAATAHLPPVKTPPAAKAH